MNRGEIVELCSSASSVEAYGLCAALREAGIEACVVGDMLGNAAGGLPLGETTMPRVWVLASQEMLAREMLAQWEDRGDLEPEEDQDEPDSCEDSEEVEPSASSEDRPEAQDSAEADADGPGLITRMLGVAGAACIVLGAVWAWQSWQQVRRYCATTKAVFVDRTLGRMVTETSPPVGLSIPRWSVRSQSDAAYVYQVDGVPHVFVLEDAVQPPDSIQVGYDPSSPENSVRGPVGMAWVPTVLMAAIGVFLWFVAYQFR